MTTEQSGATSHGEELTFDALQRRFPNIVHGVGYFSIGPGWYPFIHDMLLELEALKLSEYPKLGQVKEKFGGLRWYTDEYSVEEYRDIVSKYEELSEEVCIACGSIDEVVMAGYWIQPLCQECRKKIK
jgi:hypothetical protein